MSPGRRHHVVAIAALISALIGAGCSSDDSTADGALDCGPGATWVEEGSIEEGSPGLAEPEDAVTAYLEPFRANHPGDIEMTGGGAGSLVVAGAEVVIGRATEAPGGGWLVLSGEGCEGYDR